MKIHSLVLTTLLLTIFSTIFPQVTPPPLIAPTPPTEQTLDEVATDIEDMEPRIIRTRTAFPTFEAPEELPRFQKAEALPVAGKLSASEKKEWNDKVEKIETLIKAILVVPQNVKNLISLSQELRDSYTQVLKRIEERRSR